MTPAPVPTSKPSEVPTLTPTFSPDSLATGAPSPAPSPAPSVGELYLRLAPTASSDAAPVYYYADSDSRPLLAAELAQSKIGYQIGQDIQLADIFGRRYNTYPAIDPSYVTVTRVSQQAADAVPLHIPCLYACLHHFRTACLCAMADVACQAIYSSVCGTYL